LQNTYSNQKQGIKYLKNREQNTSKTRNKTPQKRGMNIDNEEGGR
jgi:hypothetical protein